jgi:hydroxymethylpyrimidine kinase/phosphomethylpyrimidine kinase
VTSIPRVLSIAGTDPTGGAGIQADLKSIAATGGYGMAVVTALVAQNTTGVRSVFVPPVSFLEEQLDAVSDDVRIDAVKIGMLASADIVEVVSAWLSRARPPVVVLDPVMVATSGDRLLDKEAEDAIRTLARRVDLVTPNVAELAVLASAPVALTWPDVLAQAREVAAELGVLVLAKGGHVGGEEAPDALVTPAGEVTGFPGRRIATTNTHGTGCSLSSAMAVLYPRLGSWTDAVAAAKVWLTESIAHGAALEVGAGNGPVSHFAGLWERGGLPAAPATSRWWSDIADLRSRIGSCAFVRGLAAGDLDRGAFLWYLEQDALYLRTYARALAAAATLAPTVAEQSFWAHSAHGALAAELTLHESWLPSLDGVSASPVTTAYLNHLLAPVALGDYPALVAGLLPCFWLYADLGARLRPLAVAGHPYASWLETYGDPAFAAATQEAVALVDRCAANAPPATRERMWESFRASSAHELAFFEAPLAR